MNVKVVVKNLKPGMFVAELDRPWLDTPFLLQGFLLDNPDDLAEIAKLCQFVYVDPERSTAGAAAHLQPLLPKSQATPEAQRTRSTTTIVYEGVATTQSVPARRATQARQTTTADAARSPASATPSVIIYADRQRRGAHGKDSAQAPRGSPERIWEVQEESVTVSHDEGKRTGLFKSLFGGLGRKRETAPEPTKQNDAVRLMYAKPLIRVEGNRIIHDEELVQAKQIHGRSKDLVRNIVDDIRRERKLDLDKATEVIDEMVESVNRNPDALLWLTKLKSRDSYSYDHGIDVAIHLLAFGRHLGFPKPTLQSLGLSGLMQDIGKLRLREELLKKPGKLSAAEFDEMRSHVHHSLEILRATNDIPVEVLSTVAQHHERLDGSGYPGRLGGDQIHTHGAMAGIVDSFEALSSDRPYAPAMSTHQALQQLNRWKGSVFHEGLVEQFIQCVGIFPVGSLVELNTGEVAVVTGQNKIRRLKPRLMLLLDASKHPYKYPIMLDLINEPLTAENVPYQIKRDLPVGAYDIDPEEYYL